MESGTSCSSRATRSEAWRQTVPASGMVSPLMIFSKVDLPVPLRPISDRRSRGSTCIATLSRRGKWPYAIETLSRDTKGIPSNYHADPFVAYRVVSFVQFIHRIGEILNCS